MDDLSDQTLMLVTDIKLTEQKKKNGCSAFCNAALQDNQTTGGCHPPMWH